MFEWKKKRHHEKLVGRATMYLKEKYEESEKEAVKYSIDPEPVKPAHTQVAHDPNVHYQRWCSEEELDQLEDNYTRQGTVLCL